MLQIELMNRIRNGGLGTSGMLRFCHWIRRCFATRASGGCMPWLLSLVTGSATGCRHRFWRSRTERSCLAHHPAPAAHRQIPIQFPVQRDARACAPIGCSACRYGATRAAARQPARLQHRGAGRPEFPRDNAPRHLTDAAVRIGEAFDSPPHLFLDLGPPRNDLVLGCAPRRARARSRWVLVWAPISMPAAASSATWSQESIGRTPSSAGGRSQLLSPPI